jgi:hypothetical protein
MNADVRSLILQLIPVSEKYKGFSHEERLVDAEGLYLKFFCHCWTLYVLSEGIESPVSAGDRFFDPSSINLLARAALESYLVFYYVFEEPRRKELVQLRYYVWKRYGYKVLIIGKPMEYKTQEVYFSAREEIEKLKRDIESNAVFSTYTEKVKNRIIKGADWRIPVVTDKGGMKMPSWKDIAISARFDKETIAVLYPYLAGYAHSSSWSVFQLHSVRSHSAKRKLFDNSIALLRILIPLMAGSYIQVMESSR